MLGGILLRKRLRVSRRVYPSWCESLNAQAASTQRAQASAFHEY
ncbi:MepB family protein [Brevibacterium sp.]|nr:MepB family protein [Brevibacterium sp.]